MPESKSEIRAERLSEKSGQAILKSFCPGAAMLARHVAQRLCSSLDSLPQGKNPFDLTYPDFSDSLSQLLIAAMDGLLTRGEDRLLCRIQETT